MNVKKAIKKIIKHLFPEACAGCNIRLSHENLLCTDCMYDLPITDHHKMANNRFTNHFLGRVNIEKGAAYLHFRKEGAVQELMHKFKYGGKFFIGVFLGNMAAELVEKVDYFKDIDITAHPEEHETADKFKAEWDKFGLWPLTMKNSETVERAYSMASYPAEGREIMLNVRIATPPWDRVNNVWMDVNPGIASSYIFAQKPGDKVTISGPYGEFFINESESEMLYVGGGAGMAPMRSHLYHLFRTLKTGRKVTYWYGGRSKRELFYLDHFEQLEKEFSNFKFYLALSEPMEEDNWKVKDGIEGKGDGFVGFIHNCVIDNYLDHHESPEDIELYFCGPPLMNQAVQKMGEDYGIPDEHIRFDDFGG